jgi:TPR repeat protein
MLAQLFPENRHFNSALFNAAKISEEQTNYDDALKSYMMIVENNAVTAETLKALKSILNIHLDILKDYVQAAKDYILIAQMFPDGKEAPQNLLAAAQLYRDNIKNNKKAEEILRVIITNYASSPQAQQAEKILKKN